MKIAVSALAPSLDAEVNPKFGRTRWLIVYDSETGSVEKVFNGHNYHAAQGSGTITADLVVTRSCDVVITGHLSPQAYSVLQKAGIKGYLKSDGTVLEALEDFKSNRLSQATI